MSDLWLLIDIDLEVFEPVRRSLRLTSEGHMAVELTATRISISASIWELDLDLSLEDMGLNHAVNNNERVRTMIEPHDVNFTALLVDGHNLVIIGDVLPIEEDLKDIRLEFAVVHIPRILLIN